MKSGLRYLGALSLLPAVFTPAWAATNSLSPANPGKVWQLEKLYDNSDTPLLVLNGKAHYNSQTGKALLQVSCSTAPLQRPSVVLLLVIETQRLGFNATDYEGPDATVHGPLRIKTGERPPASAKVAGWIPPGHFLHKGLDFAFGAAVSMQEMRYWLTDSAQGQRVMLTLPSTIEKDGPLIAEFVLPEDESELRKEIEPCLKAYGSNDG
jgi:hypothetical protein